MPKLVITVEEQRERIEDNRTLFGFAVTHDVDLEGSELSLLPSMGPTLVDLVMRVIAAIQQGNGGQLHKVGTSDRSTPLESHMADMRAKISEVFPSELP